MAIITTGQLIPFILFLVFIALEIYFYGSKHDTHIKRIEAIERIDEAIRRATEMGRPVLTSTGIDSLTSSDAPAVIANLDVIGHVAQETATLGVPLIIAIGPADTLPVATEIYRESCAVSGFPEAFREDNVRFLTGQQWAYTAGMFGIMERERPAANIFIGRYHAEALHFGVIGKRTGAMTIAGNTSLGMAAFFVVSCDYTLLGEEVYAAGAYLSQNKDRISSITGQDVIKWMLNVILVIGALAVSLGAGSLLNVLNL